MDKFNYKLPASFRVIGFGDNAQASITELSQLGYDGLTSCMVNDENVHPTDNDHLAIILTSENSDKVKSITKSFYQADVLTIVITSEPCTWELGICDSLTIAEPNRWKSIVKAILDPMYLRGLIAFDFHDLKTILRHGMSFKATSFFVSGTDRMKSAMDAISKQISGDIDYMAIMIYFNQNITSPIAMEEMSTLSDFLQTLPEDISICWAVFYDDNMNCDSLRVSTIFSSKTMIL